jgi:hypothetical protein
MNDKSNFINSLSPHLFWDVDINKIEPEKSKIFLVVRILEYGYTKDWVSILNFYGAEEIKNIVVKIKSLDDVSLHFVSNYFDIELSKFRCYTERLSAKNYWDY